MHTYTRRLATSASSTSRSASTSMAHHHHHAAAASRMSRSSSSTALEHDHYSMSTSPPPILTTTNAGAIWGQSSSRARSTSSSAFSPVSPTTETYTRAELQTIAESLLAQVSFGPYHLASSPVPNSAIRAAMQAPTSVSVNPPLSASSYASSSNTSLYNSTLGSSSSTIHAAFDKENLSSSATPSSSTPLAPMILLGPSARRHFEGKEGHRENNHPRARFTIGPSSESTATTSSGGERGRGVGRKSVGTGRNPPSGIAIALRRNVALVEESPREVESETDYGLAAYSHSSRPATGARRTEEEEEGRGRDRGRKGLRRAS